MKANMSNKKCISNPVLFFIGISVLVLCFVLVAYSIMYCNYNKADDRIDTLSKQYNDIELQLSNGAIRGNIVVDPNLEFLKEEIKSHQDFIERERQFLIWMLGVIAVIAIGFIGFLGYKTRKDMKVSIETEYAKKYKQLFDEHVDERINDYDKNFDKRFADTIGDKPTLIYLKEAVISEAEARGKRILFITQEDPIQSKLYPQIQLFQDFMHNGKGEVSAFQFGIYEHEKPDCNDKYDIIVYEVSEQESGSNRTDYENLMYRRFDSRCSQNQEFEQQCVLFCGNNIQVNPHVLDRTHTTTVQFAAKLRETIYLLLYFSPKLTK